MAKRHRALVASWENRRDGVGKCLPLSDDEWDEYKRVEQFNETDCYHFQNK